MPGSPHFYNIFAIVYFTRPVRFVKGSGVPTSEKVRLL
jgi:hypothetical protein